MHRDDRVLLFDLGGVLVESRGLRALAVHRSRLGDEGSVLERWRQSRAVNLYERGRIPPEVFARMFVKEWQLEATASAFMREFASWVKGFYDGAEDLLKALRRRYRVACLSNTNATHWAQLAGIAQHFDFCFLSHLTGHLKPDRDAYLNVLEILAVRADRVHFFDDQAPNVAAAQDVGMNAYHVVEYSQLPALLRSAGLETPGTLSLERP